MSAETRSSESEPSRARYVAAVDLGSHTFSVVTARADSAGGGFRVVDLLKERVALTAGVDEETQELSQGAQDRAIAALRRFGDRLRGFDPEDVRAIGTSALRVAAGADVFLQRAEVALGFPIEVVEGSVEAELCFVGVAHGGPPRQRRLVLDLGGGSTDCAIGSGLDVEWTHSESLGHLERTRTMADRGRYTEKSYRAAKKEALDRWRAVVSEADERWDGAYGTGGTIRAVSKVLAARGLDVRGGLLTAEVAKLEDEVRRIGDAHALTFDGLSERRRATFAGGLVALMAFLEAFEIDRLHVSRQGLREGLLHDLLGHSRKDDLQARTLLRLERRFGVDGARASRVADIVAQLRAGIEDHSPGWNLDDDRIDATLHAAARLHDIGQALRFRGYHKEGARVLRNSTLPGFSTRERLAVAAMVRNGRPTKRIRPKHYRKIGDPPFEAVVAWGALLVRLAVLFARPHVPLETAEMRVDSAGSDGLCLVLPAAWIEQHPQVVADLAAEAASWTARRLALTVRYQ